MFDRLRLHASCVSFGGRAVLIRGKSGSGKSDLALRLMDEPGWGIGDDRLCAELVADDQVEITKSGDRLLASAPDALAGLLEIRGLGIVRCKFASDAALVLIVDLDATAERLPGFGRQTETLLDLPLPVLYLGESHLSAPARVRAAMAIVGNPALLRA